MLLTHELAGCVCVRVQDRAVLEHLNIIIYLFFNITALVVNGLWIGNKDTEL